MRAVVSAGTPRTPRLNDTSACTVRLGARLAAAVALTAALGCSDSHKPTAVATAVMPT